MTTTPLENVKTRILSETKNVSSFVVIGETLHKLYYEDKLVKNQKEFLQWTKQNLGFSKSTTYEYIISYRIYSEIASKIPDTVRPPMFQSHCQLLAKVPEDQLVQTWVDAFKEAPGGQVTTGFLEGFLVDRQLITKTRTPFRSAKKENKKGRKRRDESSEESEQETEEDREDTPEPIAQTPSKRKMKPMLKEEPPSTPQAPDVLAAAADIMDLMERTPPKKRTRNRSGLLIRELVSNEMAEDPSHPNLLANVFDSQDRVLEVQPSLLSPQKPMQLKSRTQSHTISVSNLPFDESVVFELGKNMSLTGHFDFVAHNHKDFLQIEEHSWFGRVYCNLADCLPFSTCKLPEVQSYGGIERLLQIIFTRFANKDYTEGLFIVRAEFGADWFTPLLQHPYVVLRHLPSFSSVTETGPHLFNSYVLFYMGPNSKDFATIYRPVGLLPGVNSWASFSNQSESDLLHSFASPRKQSAPGDLNIAASALCQMTTVLDD